MKLLIEIDANGFVFSEFEVFRNDGKEIVLAPTHVDVTDRTDGPWLGKIYDSQADTFAGPPEGKVYDGAGGWTDPPDED